MFELMNTFIEGDFERIGIEHTGMKRKRAKFEAGIAFDECDEDAFPVLVYYKNDEPVALIDLELNYAYVPMEETVE